MWEKLIGETGVAPGGPAVAPLLTRAGREEAAALLEDTGHPGAEVILRTLPPEPAAGASPERVARVLPVRVGGILGAALAEDRSLTPRLLAALSGTAGLPEREETPPPDAFHRNAAVWGSLLPFEALGRFIGTFESPKDLLDMTGSREARSEEGRELLARLVLAGAEPPALLAFLDKYPASGFEDLRSAFREGPGGVRLLLDRSLALRDDVFLPAAFVLPGWDQPVRFALDHPRTALVARIALFAGAGFFLFLGLSFLLPNPGDRHLARPSVGQRFIRRVILSSIFAGTLLFFLEPSLLRQPETPPAAQDEPARLSLASLTNPPVSPMKDIQIDDVTLLILLIFFTLQVGLYVFCLVKLSEIRRQRIPNVTKLHLLENEENLFDGGLYLGLGGTVASLIFLALGIVEASLMAAYASTLFGILFVSFFKIFHLRPLRRRLILSDGGSV